MPSEASRKKAASMFYRDDESIAAALDEARAEGEQRGAERERWECYRTVCTATNSEHAVRLIAARGSMRGPEE